QPFPFTELPKPRRKAGRLRKKTAEDSPSPGGEGRLVRHSAFLTAIVLLTKAVDEGGGEGELLGHSLFSLEDVPTAATGVLRARLSPIRSCTTGLLSSPLPNRSRSGIIILSGAGTSLPPRC